MKKAAIFAQISRAVCLVSLLSLPSLAAKSPFLAALTGHKGPVFSVHYSQDGRRILSGSFDGTLKLWDPAAKTEVSTWEGHTDNVRAVALSPDGTRAVSGGSDRKIIFWNAESGTVISRLPGHDGIIRCIAYSPDGRHFLSGGDDKKLKLWEVVSSTDDPKLVATWEGHTDGVNACVFSPDGKTALSGSQDKTIIFWDVATGKALDTLTGHAAPVLAVAFSPDGKLALSAGGDNDIVVWDAANRKQLSRWPGHTDEVDFVVVSPDNTMALTGGRDKTIKIWDIPSRQPLKTISGGDEYIYSAAFSPDGKEAVIGVGDTLRLLDINAIRPPRELVKAAQKLSTTLALVEPPDGFLDPEAKGTLRVSVANSGGLPADVKLAFKVPETEGFVGLKEIPKPLKVYPGRTEIRDFPVEVSKTVATGTVTVTVEVKDSNGFDADPAAIDLKTRAFAEPKLSIEDIKVGGDGTIHMDQPAVVVMTVKNSGGIAWDVAARFNGLNGMAIASLVGAGSDTGIKALSDTHVKIGTIEPGETKRLQLAFQVTPNFKGESHLPLSVALTEKRPRYNMTTQSLALALSK
jgi:hypothetical protein